MVEAGASAGGAMTQMDLEDAAELMRVMGHPIRLSLIRSIANNELSVGEIENVTGVIQPTLSQQLAVLRKAEMVQTRRQAKQIFYSLNAERLETITCFICRLAGQMGLGPNSASASEKASEAEGAAMPSAKRATAPSQSHGAAMFARVERPKG